MPFCGSCGNEIPGGKKFCGKCGESLKLKVSSPVSPAEEPGNIPPPPPPPPPSSSPQLSSSSSPPPLSTYPAPPPPKKSGGLSGDKLVVAVLVIIAIAAAAIYLGIPSMKLGNTGSSVSVNTPPQTQQMSYMQTPVTITTISPYSATPPLPTTAGAVYKTVFIRNEPYNQVFSTNKLFTKDEIEVFSFNLQQPPMIVQFELTPQTVSDQKLVDIGKSNERYITATYASPAARFELKVINTDTGYVETTMIYRANYNGMLKQEYTVRTAGNYRIQMSGDEVRANVAVLTKQS
jgi:hypothetical protein